MGEMLRPPFSSTIIGWPFSDSTAAEVLSLNRPPTAHRVADLVENTEDAHTRRAY